MAIPRSGLGGYGQRTISIAESDKDVPEMWTPDCSVGECHVPDFSGQSYLEFKTMMEQNVAIFTDIEVK